jgi:hypothetical protein
MRHDGTGTALDPTSAWSYPNSVPNLILYTNSLCATTMGDAVPGKLKSLQLAPFAKRAAQLEKFKPIITYWCKSHHALHVPDCRY